jgi:hypothetical protein
MRLEDLEKNGYRVYENHFKDEFESDVLYQKKIYDTKHGGKYYITFKYCVFPEPYKCVIEAEIQLIKDGITFNLLVLHCQDHEIEDIERLIGEVRMFTLAE